MRECNIQFEWCEIVCLCVILTVSGISCLLYVVIEEEDSVLVQVEADGKNRDMHTGLLVTHQVRPSVQNLH